jgi:hypothetical protein
MTGHDVTPTTWEARVLGHAVISILKAIHEDIPNLPPRPGPPRTTCPDCGALIPASEPCDVCELRNQRRMTTAEALTEIEFLTDQGCDLDYIARALNRTTDSIGQLLRRQDRRDILDRLGRRAA